VNGSAGCVSWSVRVGWRYFALHTDKGCARRVRLRFQSIASSRAAAASGWPGSADCEQKLSPGHPLPAASHRMPAPEDEDREEGSQEKPADSLHFLCAHPHAAQRAVPGWRGGLGRVGADLASAGSMRPPPSPARHVSTARIATTKARQETTRMPTRHATTHVSRETPRHHPSKPIRPGDSRKTPLVKMRIADGRHWPPGQTDSTADNPA